MEIDGEESPKESRVRLKAKERKKPKLQLET